MDYKHTIEVDRTAWFIRFYVWLWDAKETDINVCKLFWGYFPLFVIPWLVMRLLWIPLRPIASYFDGYLSSWYGRKKAKKKAKMPRPPRPPRAPKEKREHSRAQAFLNAVGAIVGAVTQVLAAVWWHLIGRHKRVKATLGFIARWGGVLIVMALTLGAVATIVYFAIKYFTVTLAILAAAAGIVGGVVVIVLAIMLDEAFGILGKVRDRFLRPSGRGIRTFARLLWAGARGVKSQTCPQIKVRSEKAEHAS